MMSNSQTKRVRVSDVIAKPFHRLHAAIKVNDASSFWLKGGRGCVHANTLLSTPNGFIKISEFNGGAIHVFNGKNVTTAFAPRPLEYKPEPLYKVTLKTGASIIATNKHRFLTDKGWETLSSLNIGCVIPLADVSHPQTISDISPSMYPQDALHYLDIALGFLYYYWQGHHQYDAQPLHGSNTYQDILHTLIDEQQHNFHTLNQKDDPDTAYTNGRKHFSLCLPSSLPALLSAEGSNCTNWENHSDEIFFARLLHLLQLCRQFHASNIRCAPVQELAKLILDFASDTNQSEIHQKVCDMLRLDVGDESYSDSFHYHRDLRCQKGEVVSIEYYGTDVFYDIFVPRYNNYITKGGIINHNSTKSSFAAIEIVLGVMRDPDANGLVLRKVGDTIRTSVLQTVLWAIDMLGVDAYFSHTKSPPEITYIPTGQKIIFKGLDDPLKLKSIKMKRGYFKFLWFEEAADFAGMEEIRNVEQSVLRGGDKFVEFLTYNPPNDPAAWVNAECDKQVDGRIVHESCYLDVPPEWLGEKFIKDAEALLQNDPLKYEHEYMGKAVGRAEQIVFHGKWKQKDFTTPPTHLMYQGRFFFGLDHGFANDPAALVRCYIMAENGCSNLYIDYEAGGVGIEIEELPQLLNSVPESRKWPIYGDSARPETNSYLSNKGYNVANVPKWKGSVEDGIEYIRSFHTIYIHPRCIRTIEEFKTYSYKVDKNTQQILPVIVDKNNHCFVGETLIATSKGEVPIVDVQKGDMVLTRKGYRRVLKKFCNGEKEVKSYRFANGQSLTATDTHYIITASGDFMISEITSRHRLYFRSEGCRYLQAKNQRFAYTMAKGIAAIRMLTQEAIGYISGAVRPRATRFICIARFMKTISARYRKATTFITSMIIRLITTQAIFNACWGRSTLHIMLLSIVQKTKALLEKTLITSATLQKHGTQAKKAACGILSTIKSIKNRFIKWLSAHVQIAAHSTSLPIGKETAFAAINANPPFAENRGMTTSLLNAPFAKKILKRTSIAKQKHVLKNVQPVYDLMIEGEHEYFANGILVHNCIDALRYSLSDYIMKDISILDVL